MYQGKKKSKLKKILAILLVTTSLVIYQYKKELKTPLSIDNKEEISVLIHKGDSVKEIAKTLKEKNIISSPTVFYWYARINHLDSTIISGRFLLSPSLTIPEILTKIGDPKESEAILTVQEGLTVQDIDTRISEMELSKQGEFMSAVKNFQDYKEYPFLDEKILKSLKLPLEGYLFPDTYFLDPSNFAQTSVIYKALNNFNKKISPLLKDIEKSGHSLHEIITMASIIEKEVRTEEDRKIVSGILWKRLASGWRLDTDATLLYMKSSNEITKQDIEADSPYNTRKIKGLPPGPIGNPSLNSIEAALYPTHSNYWFYLTTDEGDVIYAKNNEEHEQNKAKYF